MVIDSKDTYKWSLYRMSQKLRDIGDLDYLAKYGKL
jgi:hypothetical protein